MGGKQRSSDGLDSVLNARCWMLDAGCWMKDSYAVIQYPVSSIQYLAANKEDSHWETIAFDRFGV